MVAETLTSTRAASTFPVAQSHTAGTVLCTYGSYEVVANVEDGDIFEMCKLPAGAVVICGWVYADDMDTGAEALDMDLGWADNGSESADPDGFGDFGVWTGDAITDLKAAGHIYYPLGNIMKDGPISFTAETMVQFEANAAATTFAAGTLSCMILYLTP